MKGAAVLMDGTTGKGLTAGNGPDVAFTGGKCAFIGNGTFGGGTVKLQMKIDIGPSSLTPVYFDVPSATLSAAGYFVADLPPGTYRAVTATATAFYARLISIPQG